MFFRSRINKLEKRSLVDGDGHVSWLNLQGLNSGNYSSRASEAIAAVTACINLISSTMSQMKPMIRRGGVPIDDHMLSAMLRSPDRDLSWQQWLQMFVAEYLVSGNAVAVMRRRGDALVLTFVPWRYVTWFDSNTYQLTLPTPRGIGASSEEFDVSDVLHWRAMAGSRDGGFTGRSVIDRCADVLNLTGNLDKAVQSYLANGSAPSGIFTIKGQLSQSQRKDLQSTFGEQYSGAINRGKPMVIGNDADYKQVGNSADDAQLVQLRDHQIREIARIFNIPPAFLALESSMTYASIYEATRHLLISLRGHVASFTSAFTVKFLATDEELILDDTDLDKEPAAQRYAAHKLAIESGIYDADHARNMEKIRDVS